jgi:UDP-glucose 4-epimerase
MLTYTRSNFPPRFLITGGMGFIGSHLAEALLAAGNQVTVVDNLSTGRFENIEHLVGSSNFRFAIDDIKNEAVLDRLVSESDVIFHLAATVGVKLVVDNPVHTVENNVLGTEVTLRTALRYRTKVLLASTSEVYGKGLTIPFKEDDDILLGPSERNRWAYAASKLVDEFLGLAYHNEKGLPVVVFRLFNTVGPRQTGQYGMVIPRFVQQALHGEPLTVHDDGKQSRCFMHVNDAVRALIALAECPDAVGRVFNVGSTEEITILELAHRILSLVQDYKEVRLPYLTADNTATQVLTERSSQDNIILVPYKEVYGKDFEDMRRRVPSISKIHNYTGWKPNLSVNQILNDVIKEFVPERLSVAVAD